MKGSEKEDVISVDEDKVRSLIYPRALNICNGQMNKDAKLLSRQNNTVLSSTYERIRAKDAPPGEDEDGEGILVKKAVG